MNQDKYLWQNIYEIRSMADTGPHASPPTNSWLPYMVQNAENRPVAGTSHRNPRESGY